MKLDPAVLRSIEPVDVFKPSRPLALLFGLGLGAVLLITLMFFPTVRALGGTPITVPGGAAAVAAVAFFLWRSWGRTALNDEVLVVNGRMFRWEHITRIEEECTSGDDTVTSAGYGGGGAVDKSFRFAIHVAEEGAPETKVVLPRAARSEVLREEILKHLTPAALQASSLDAMLPPGMR